MAKRQIFSDDETVSEMDMLGETAEQSDDAMDEILDEYSDQGEEETEEENDEEEDEVAAAPVKNVKTPYRMDKRETTIMDAAIVQLEQAKLYDMFLKHDLFKGVKANPIALKRVEKELKDFILERMQILLGMKSEKKLQEVQSFKVVLPFNEVEVDFLKALSLKGTQGASAKAKPLQAKALSTIEQVEQTEEVEEEEEEQTLQSMADEEEDEEEDLPPPPPKKKVVVQQPVKTVKKKTVPPQVKKVVKSKTPRISDEEVKAERAKLARQGIRLSDDEIRAAKMDILEMAKKNKPAHLMNETELRAEAKRQAGDKKPLPKGALPMPGADAQIAHYMTQQTMRQTMQPENSMLMNLLGKKLGFSTTGIHQDTSTGDD